MKYKVIRQFRDKYTGEIILPGVSFICDETDRIKNLLGRGLIKKDSDSLTKEEIVNWLDDKGIKFSKNAKKDELIKLLGGD